MDQLDIAIHQTGLDAEGGVIGLAARMGVNHQVLVNKLNPNNDQNKLSVREAVAMMLQTGDVRILVEMARIVGYEVVRKDGINDIDLVLAVLNLDVEHGDVVRTIRDAATDKRITERERAGALKEIAELRASLDELAASVARA